MILTAKSQRIWRKPYSIPKLYTTNLTWTDMGLNTGLCGDSLATNCLCDCTTNVHSYQAVVTYKDAVHTSQKTIMRFHYKEQSVHACSNGSTQHSL
jgi:hypothetical protein